jgi:hypothetical protein
MKMLSLKNLLSINILILSFNCFAQKNSSLDSLFRIEAENKRNKTIDSTTLKKNLLKYANNQELIIEGILLYQNNYSFDDGKKCLTKKFILVNKVFAGDSSYADHVIEILSKDCDPEYNSSKHSNKNNYFNKQGDTALVFVSKLFEDLPLYDSKISKPNKFFGYGLNYNKNKPIKAFHYQFESINEVKRFVKTAIKKE